MIKTEDKKEITNLHESLFWDKDDARRQYIQKDMANDGDPLVEDTFFPQIGHKGHEIDMSRDSYIWCFTGVRGSGKSISMTYFAVRCAVKYGLRLVANYPIECRIIRLDGTSYIIKAEPLDLYTLLCFDNDYRDCLVLMDEAPDIISHMAAMTWKNRLLNIFVRQLRKNHNSLFLGAQQFELIDKSMRWQTDILVECTDASRKYGWGSHKRGKCVMLKLKDNSGMWTGESYDDAIFRERHQFAKTFHDPALKINLYPRVLWGDEAHEPVYDSFYVQDVWESLKKVDMKLMTYQVGRSDLDNSDYLERSMPVISSIINTDNPVVERKELYKVLKLTPKEKVSLAHKIHDAGAENYGDGGKYLDFSKFNMDSFARAEVK